MDNVLKVREKLIEIFEKHTKVKLHEEDLRSDITKRIGVDSLTRIKILVAIEQKFSLDIPEKEALGLKTINDLTEYIETRLGL